MDEQVFTVLRAYPAIYMACHVEHRTRGQSATGLTSRDSTLLAHVEPEGTGPAALARHLGIVPSTLSASLSRLANGGFVTIEDDPRDARRKRVRLTAAGRDAVAGSSVLEADRVAALLAAMAAEERQVAVEGLALLAKAARAMRERGE